MYVASRTPIANKNIKTMLEMFQNRHLVCLFFWINKSCTLSFLQVLEVRDGWIYLTFSKRKCCSAKTNFLMTTAGPKIWLRWFFVAHINNYPVWKRKPISPFRHSWLTRLSHMDKEEMIAWNQSVGQQVSELKQDKEHLKTHTQNQWISQWFSKTDSGVIT